MGYTERYMKAVEHKVKHYFQPTNSACGESAIATLLSYYDKPVKPEQILEEVPQIPNEDGEPFGSITSQLVTWMQKQGFKCKMFSFDCLVTDLSWHGYSTAKLLERLEAIRDVRDVPALGKHYTKAYIDAYIEMLRAGAKLEIQPLVTPELLYNLVKSGPVFTTFCSTVARGKGRTVSYGERKSKLDDVNGRVLNHSVVIYGYDAKGDFLIADPWEGRIKLKPLKLAICIMAAQVECDNQLVIIET